MIFEPIKYVENKDFFLELIDTYIRLVEVTAESNKMVIPQISTVSEIVTDELIEMGIITDGSEHNLLRNYLKSNYIKFISSVAFYVGNRALFGNYMDKLSNAKRRHLQDIEAKSGKPSFVDFFAGAGGLSCGFLQAGYRVDFANDFEDVCVRTYKFNHPELSSKKVLREDIRKIVDNISDYV